MKLELYNITPYLPYNLICQYKDAEDMQYELVTANIVETKGSKQYGRIGVDVLLKDNSYKPILRAMTEITAFIDDVKPNFTFLDYQIYGDELLNYISYSDTILLLKAHFDIFGLIPKNLAISKPTINDGNWIFRYDE